MIPIKTNNYNHMKTIGLIGGTGWVSTQAYYRIINEAVNQRLGGLNFPKIVLYSVNYGEIYACNQKEDRQGVYEIIKKGADTLVAANVDFIALCANTIHFTYPKLSEKIQLPFVHIADATGRAILEKGIKKVGLLGTRETMELDFYKERLAAMNIELIVPNKEERDFIHTSIMEELLKEEFKESTRAGFVSVMDRLKNEGAEGMILGCTEIPLLIRENDYDLPLFSTLDIHAKAIADYSLE